MDLLENTLIVKKQPEDHWSGFDRLLQKDENGIKFSQKQMKFSQYLISLLKDFDTKLLQGSLIKKNNENTENVIIEDNKIEENEQEENYLQNKTPDDENTIKKNQSELRCIVCNGNRPSTLHLLKFKQFPLCGHIIHLKCVEVIFKIVIDKSNNFRVDENFNKCKFDSLLIFPGLKNIKFNITKTNERIIKIIRRF